MLLSTVHRSRLMYCKKYYSYHCYYYLFILGCLNIGWALGRAERHLSSSNETGRSIRTPSVSTMTYSKCPFLSTQNLSGDLVFQRYWTPSKCVKKINKD